MLSLISDEGQALPGVQALIRFLSEQRVPIGLCSSSPLPLSSHPCRARSTGRTGTPVYRCILGAMTTPGSSNKPGTKMALTTAALFLIAIGCRQVLGPPRDESNFPQGYDAVAAAPDSHKVIFENALVRVLEVTMPPPGKTEPMHHHRWPGFFLDWDTGGKSPPIRYHQPGNVVRDIPSTDYPVTTGHWSVHWMKPEPMHAIETVDNHGSPSDPHSVRVEIKVQP